MLKISSYVVEVVRRTGILFYLARTIQKCQSLRVRLLQKYSIFLKDSTWLQATLLESLSYLDPVILRYFGIWIKECSVHYTLFSFASKFRCKHRKLLLIKLISFDVT